MSTTHNVTIASCHTGKSNTPQPAVDLTAPVAATALLGRVLPLQPGRIVRDGFYGLEHCTYGEIVRLTDSNVWIKWDCDGQTRRHPRRRFSQWFTVVEARPTDELSGAARTPKTYGNKENKQN